MIYILSFRDSAPEGVQVVDTTKNQGPWSGLSPFVIGPCKVADGRTSQNMENAWQFSKVYTRHVGSTGNPSPKWWEWSTRGFKRKDAVRYPMGRGAVPEYSYWDGGHLGYIEAREQIYIPLYVNAVSQTLSFRHLRIAYEEQGDIALRDYDGYRHDLLGHTYDEVIADPKRKMGHAFVLAMLLDGHLEVANGRPIS